MKRTIHEVLVGTSPAYALERSAVSLRRAAPVDYEAFIESLHSYAREVAALVVSSPPHDSAHTDAYNKGAVNALLGIANRMRAAEETLRAYEGTQAAPNHNKLRF